MAEAELLFHAGRGETKVVAQHVERGVHQSERAPVETPAGSKSSRIPMDVFCPSHERARECPESLMLHKSIHETAAFAACQTVPAPHVESMGLAIQALHIGMRV